MRLNLFCESKENVGYIPDWIKVAYKDNKQSMELTLDVQGDISYDDNKLNCLVKGQLVPWVLLNCNSGEEINLYDNEFLQKEYEKEIKKFLLKATEITVGIYPANDSDNEFKLARKDKYGIGNGTYEEYDEKKDNFSLVHFNFEPEFNI